MHQDDGEIPVLFLARSPMTVAKHLDFLFHLEQALFGWRETVLPRQKIAGQSLQMPVPQPSARVEVGLQD
jgi:hypothetical protein